MTCLSEFIGFITNVLVLFFINLNGNINGMKWNIRRYMPTLFVFLFVFLFIPLAPGSRDQVPEYRAKAYIMTQFINEFEWPKSSGMEDKDKPFIIGIIDSNPFEKYLEDHLSARKIFGKIPLIKYLKQPEEVTGCNLVFICSAVSSKKLAKILDYVGERPILTVADSEDFFDSGTILILINHYDADNRLVVAANLNEGALRRAGLKNVVAGFFQKTNLVVRNPYIEYLEKAKVIEKFAKTSMWPSQSQSNASNMFIVKVIGDNVFGSYLEKAFKNTRITNRRVKVQYISRPDEISDANLLFISRSKYNVINDILAYTKKKPILTVSDVEGFCDRGVHLNIISDNGRFRYEANVITAAESGIYFSSVVNNNPNCRVISKK